MAARDIIVIGASAGGFEAVQRLAAGFPADLRAAIFVTVHLVERGEGILPGLLNQVGALYAADAEDGEAIKPGRIYVAPPDYHLTFDGSRIQLSHGPRENMQRPCVNVMFRSAAATFGERVVGVLLTGLLDDGAAGLWEIQQRHGVTIVQDPEEATFRSMPDSAIRGLHVQYIVRLAEMVPLLTRFAMADEHRPFQDVPLEARIQASGQACAECGGAMTAVQMGNLREFRCHIGHRFGLETLIAEKRAVVERALGAALSQSQELTELLGDALSQAGSPESIRLTEEIAKRMKEQDVLRDLAAVPGNPANEASDVNEAE